MALFLSVAYFLILFFFGWQVTRWILNENRIEHLVAFAGVLGIGLYVFFINMLGLFVPIQTVLYFVLGAFLLFGSGSFLCRRFQIFGDRRPLEWGAGAWWGKALLLFALFVTISVSFISFNHRMDLAAVREPTAVTMSEGNFPPVEIFNPTDPLLYHYAPDLFSAAIYKVTGMPIYLAYDLQKGILAGILFLLGFLITRLFIKDSRVAFFAAVSMLYAGTLVFFSAANGIPTLFNKFILGQDVSAPFKFLSDAIVGEYTAPVINSVVTTHWGAMAFALMMAVVYIYFFLLQQEDKLRSWPAFFAGGFLLALLALVSEPYFAILCAVIFLFPVALGLLKRDWKKTKEVFMVSVVLLLITAPVALSQGGLLRQAVAQQLHLSASKNAYDAILYTTDQSDLNNSANQALKPFKVGTPWLLSDNKPLYDFRFLAELALLLIVAIPALVFLFKQHFQPALFLTGLLLLFFSIPLFIDSDFPDIAGQLTRLFIPIPLVAGLVVGGVLATLYLSTQKTLLKASLLFLALVLMAQGVWTHAAWSAFGDPPGTWNPDAEFVVQANTPEASAYGWVKKNTTIKDLFFILDNDYAECGPSSAPNCLFVLNTGRMAPTFSLAGTGGATRAERASSGKVALFAEASKSCSGAILQQLNYRYLYVSEQWPKDMEAKCIKQNKLNLLFEVNEEDTFVRIYKIEEGVKL